MNELAGIASDVEDPVAVIRLERPEKLNAFTTFDVRRPPREDRGSGGTRHGNREP